MDINQISTGFIDVPGKISLNIYAQGCKLRCLGCQNSHLWEFGKGNEIYFWEIGNILLEYDMCDWVCFLGGDAVYQPEEFVSFCKEIKRYDKNICLYTGDLFEDILDLLDDVDLVIDGQYQQENGPVTEDGTNQRIWLKEDGEWFLIGNWRELSVRINNTFTYNKGINYAFTPKF